MKSGTKKTDILSLFWVPHSLLSHFISILLRSTTSLYNNLSTMNAAKRANAVRSIRSQIFELESLDSFTPTVQATIRQLYQEADKRGGTDHLTARDLSCRFDSAHVDCQQVHDAASLLESIKSNFLGVEKSVIWAEHHSNTLWMVEPRHVLHGFHFGTAEDIEENAQKLAAPDADIHRRIEILSSCRRLHQRLNEGTIDPAMSYVISQPKLRLPTMSSLASRSIASKPSKMHPLAINP